MIFPSGSPLFFNAAISCSSVKSRYDSNMFLPRLLIQYYLPRRFFLPLRCSLPPATSFIAAVFFTAAVSSTAVVSSTAAVSSTACVAAQSHRQAHLLPPMRSGNRYPPSSEWMPQNHSSRAPVCQHPRLHCR